jgi:hypothetical protein
MHATMVSAVPEVKQVANVPPIGLDAEAYDAYA